MAIQKNANLGWCILGVEFGGDGAIDVDAFADFFVARLVDTPIGPRSWRIHKAGRGEAHTGFGAPTRAQLAVPELAHGMIISGAAGFLSLLSFERTRRVDKNWGGVYPDRIRGHEIQLNLKNLDDAAVDEARARAIALLPALRALGASGGELSWRARGVNHDEDLAALGLR